MKTNELMDDTTMWERMTVKTCPFCGGDAAIRYNHSGLPKDPRPTHVFVMCNWCGCGTDQFIINNRHGVDERTCNAIAAWERRVEKE